MAIRDYQCKICRRALETETLCADCSKEYEKRSSVLNIKDEDIRDRNLSWLCYQGDDILRGSW